MIANVARTGVSEKQFRRDLDPDQVAHDLYGVMLGYHHAARLLEEPKADQRARAGFEAILGQARLAGPRRTAKESA